MCYIIFSHVGHLPVVSTFSVSVDTNIKPFCVYTALNRVPIYFHIDFLGCSLIASYFRAILYKLTYTITDLLYCFGSILFLCKNTKWITKLTLKCCRLYWTSLLRFQCWRILQQLLFISNTVILFFLLPILQLSLQVSRSRFNPKPTSVYSWVPVDHLQSISYQPGQLIQVFLRQVVHVHMLPANVLQNVLNEPLCSRFWRKRRDFYVISIQLRLNRRWQTMSPQVYLVVVLKVSV